MAVQDRITPTEKERKLFSVLTNTLQHSGLPTVLRCAGGWVRDKLLGLESDDIDIAIDDMLGREFAEHVNKFLESQSLDTRKVAVIMSNPEQSKHLETARMTVDGLELDLVNLRSETYTDSRIPEMTFGTPQQDAERRDFTINSLFYNLNTSQVEDFTGRGIDDLKAGIIRAPLPPHQTFLDDPLRVLRALRFAARFGFELEASLQEAAATAEVRDALAKKVSRERMGVELEKMFTGPRPVRAMQDLDRLQLFPAVFAMPQGQEEQLSTSYGSRGVQLMDAAEQLLGSWQPAGGGFSKEERRLTLMAAMLLPLRAAKAPLKGSKTQPLTSHLLLHGIKWRTSDADCVEVAHREAGTLLDAFHQLQGVQTSGASEALRERLGMSLRSLKASRWRIGILLAPLLGMRQATPLAVDAAEAAARQLPASSSPSALDMDSPDNRSECCRQLDAAISALELDQCWDWKPLLDGKEIMRLLGIKGPKVGALTASLTRYQLSHPKATKDDAEAFLLQKKESL